MHTATDYLAQKQQQQHKLIRLLLALLIFLSVAFSLMPAGLNWNNIDPKGNFAAGSMIFQLQYGTLFALAGLTILINRKWAKIHLIHQNPFLLLMIAYCALSCIWSPYPVTSIKRVIQLAGLLIVGIAIAPPAGSRKLLTHTLLLTFVSLQLLSLPVILIAPDIGIEYALGSAWRGILSQKNALGSVSALAAILWLSQLLSRTYPARIAIAGLLFSFFMLIMSKSTTALLVCLLCGTLYLLIRRKFIRHIADLVQLLLILTIIVVLPLFLFLIIAGRMPTWAELFYPVEYFTGKSSDLTGRTEIWLLIMDEIGRHPILGLGYGAFWLGEGSLSQFIIDLLGWIPLQAHNGYLDIVNELGIVGFTILLTLFIVHIRHLLRLMAVDREEAALHWSIFAFILITNFSESGLFRGVTFQNILFIYSATAIAAQLTFDRLARQEEK